MPRTPKRRRNDDAPLLTGLRPNESLDARHEKSGPDGREGHAYCGY
jgi:hypothetical protein